VKRLSEAGSPDARAHQHNGSRIEVKDVGFAYAEQPVLKGVSFDINAGEFVGLIGPNGGGKTTLIRLMLGELTPDSGEVNVFGTPAHALGWRERSRIGYVPQKAQVDLKFPASALEVVLMGAYSRAGLFRSARRFKAQALDALEQVGTKDLADEPIGELSGGQQQRVLVARALVSEPDILIMDEPTTGFDSRTLIKFFELLKRLQEERGLSIVVASHEVGLLRRYSDTLACLNRMVHWHGKTDRISDELVREAYTCEFADYLSARSEFDEVKPKAGQE